MTLPDLEARSAFLAELCAILICVSHRFSHRGPGTMTGQSLFIAGWVVVILGLFIYLGTALVAVIRVSRQYSRAMSGSFSFALSAGFATASRRWWLAIPIVVGVALLLVGSKL